MSATPKNAGAGLDAPHWLPSSTGPEAAPQDSQDALQMLLAFACIHDQAVQRRRRKDSGVAPVSYDEYFGLDDVLRLVAARALAITGADGVAIALAKEDAIVCRATIGKIAPGPGVRLDPNSGFSGACLRNGETVRCDDSETDPRVNAQACRTLGTRSMVAVPLTAKTRVIGLIEAFSSETFGFNDSDVKSLNLLGELVLAAIHPAEEDRLAQLAEQILPKPVVAEPGKASDNQLSDARVFASAEVETPASILTPTEAREPEVPVVASGKEARNLEPPTFAVSTKNSDDIAAALAFVENLLAKAQERASESPALSESARIAIRPEPDAAADSGPAPMPMPVLTFPQEKRSFSGIIASAALVLVAVGLGWGWLHHAEQLTSANTTHATPFSAPAPGTSSDSNVSSDSKEPDLPAQPAPKAGVIPEVAGVRHWSSPESSTVVVDLGDQVQYEAHTLDNPPRIYFDLFDTKLAPGLLNQSILVDDTFIKRVRMAQPSDGTTRVVLDTKGLTEVSVKLDPNPYRLTIDVHKPPVNPTPVLNKPSPSIATSPVRTSRAASANSSEFRVVLDAGHGGWDLGTVGRKGLLEKDLVLDIVERLGKLIQEKLGADVVYTRTDDSYLPLEKRAEIANINKADLFLSVHANYSDLATARGVETYYTTTYSSIKARTAEDDATLKDVDWTGVDIREKVTNSHRLATDVQDALFATLATRNPAIRNRGVKDAQYVVLTGTQMPAILAEVSFVSSPADEDNLANSAYRQQIAEAIYRGVARYRIETRHTKLASRGKLPANSE
jgi:N-acetylmuramoyl-L-alanine amidase/putative methionine-R-sulfoxide reductase with GAF domain